MLKPGMFINDRYEIIEKVGSGGMADVYKARCHRLNRYVAIKVLKAEYSNDTTFVLKFRAEAQSAAGLSHANIVNVYDVGNDDGLYYIVMELVEGITLKSFIERKGKLEIKEAIGIAIQIASGLEAAHDNHIIHRDIKPQNIIISREGKVKVTDFGIAKAASSNTVTSNAMGSVHYISPEQARGGYCDEKSDIYSLGVTLYEMLSGKVPFDGDSTVSVALLHIQADATLLRQLNTEVSVSLEKIVQKCMDKKPERRYLTVAELIADLKQSILNPNGDFVVLASPIVDDSPTINISEEEMNEIKNASKGVVVGAVASGMLEQDEMDAKLLEGEPTSLEELEEDGDLEDFVDSDIDPKLDKIFVIGGISVAIVLGIIVIAIIGNMLGVFGASSRRPSSSTEPSASPTSTVLPSATPEVLSVVMPELEGRSLAEAIRIFEESSPKIAYTYSYETNETIQKDYVIRQSVEAGTEVTATQTVHLTISDGTDAFALAKTSGFSLEQAYNLLKDQNISYTHEYEYNTEYEKDVVIGTRPTAGTMVNKGDSVVIRVSLGKEVKYTNVPDLSGLTRIQARDTLEGQELKLGNVTEEYDTTVPEGLVISQSEREGSRVEYDTTVDIVISKGVEPTTAPTSTPEPSYTRTVTIRKNDVFAPYVEDGVVSTDAAGTVYVYIEFSDGSTEDIIAAEYFTLDKFISRFGNNEVTKEVTTKVAGQANVRVYLDNQLQSTVQINFK